MAIVERPEPAKRESAERPIRIFLNEVPVAVSQGSPFGLSELAVGYLLSEGLIADRDSLVEVVEVPEEAAVYVASEMCIRDRLSSIMDSMTGRMPSSSSNPARNAEFMIPEPRTLSLIHIFKLETDYSAGDGGQVGTRLAAFIEML